MIGKELDKQIYPEGEATLGLKEGFLDVDDVKANFQQGVLSIKAPRKCKRREIPIE